MPCKGLYIHVPFCKRKCVYCDFYSASDLSLTDGFVKAAVRNIKAVGLEYDTVYFGGGTPSLLSAKQISEILSAACIRSDAEISMECNPESTDPDYLREISSAGINRLSFGVQSLNDGELLSLGRLHSSEKAVQAILSAEKAGFENISADIMLAVSGQSPKSLSDTLDRLVSLPLTHVSAYMLKVEDGTPLSRDAGLISKIPDDDLTADMYLTAVQKLAEAGFEQYEISNFTKDGFECRHNLKYWQCEEYFGTGPSAHSFLNGERFSCPKDTVKFISQPLQEKLSLGSGGDRSEKAMLALRLAKTGLSLNDYPETEKKAEPLIKAGLLKKERGAIKLTPEGCLVSNQIICFLAVM